MIVTSDGYVCSRRQCPVPSFEEQEFLWRSGPILRRGSQGRYVQYIQLYLGVPCTGFFGRQTQAAVKQLQRDYGLVVDGVVGPRTWQFMFIEGGL